MLSKSILSKQSSQSLDINQDGDLSEAITIGIIGGGQLGGMLVQNQVSVEIRKTRYLIYSPEEPIFPGTCDNPGRKPYNVSWVKGEYDDEGGIYRLGEKCNILTYELEIFR